MDSFCLLPINKKKLPVFRILNFEFGIFSDFEDSDFGFYYSMIFTPLAIATAFRKSSMAPPVSFTFHRREPTIMMV